MQRLAILEYLEGTRAHPPADEIYSAVHEKYPTIARATVYNTLDALTKSGTILQLTVDPAAARYDADTRPHVHFRCRVCSRVYDVDAKESRCLGEEVDGHQVESVRTYAFGICAECRDGSLTGSPHERDAKKKPAKASDVADRPKRTRSPAFEPPAAHGQENDPKGRSSKPSGTGDRMKKTEPSSSEPPATRAQENGPKGRSPKPSDSPRRRRTADAP